MARNNKATTKKATTDVPEPAKLPVPKPKQAAKSTRKGNYGLHDEPRDAQAVKELAENR